MADRKASVALELQAAQFKAEAAAAGRSVDNLDRDVEKLDRDLNKIPADAAKASAALAVMGGTAKEVGKNVGTAGDETGKFDKRIGELKTSVKDLASEFDRTGDPSLLKKFRADSSELSGLMKMRKEIAGAAGDLEQLGIKAEKASFSMGDLMGPGIALAAGPALAAAGGALAGLAGAGVAGLGVFGAVMGNPKLFQDEWSKALNTVEKDFLDATQPFTGPTLDAIKTIGPTVASWHLADALAPAVKYVPELVAGVEGFATGIVHGVAALADKGGPAVKVLSDGMTKLGDAADSAFSSIADGAQGGAEALHDVISATALVVEGFGKIVQGAEDAYGFIQNHPIGAAIATGGLSIGASIFSNILGNTDDVTGKLTKTQKGLADAAREAGHAVDQEGVDLTALQQGLNATKVDADSLAETMSLKVLNTTMGLDQALLGFDQALLGVAESVKQNGHALDEHTAKGLANRQMMLGLVQANIASYQSNVAAGMGAEAAASAYDGGTAAINRQLRAAGFNQTAIDGMIGKYKQVPKNIDTDIAMHGLTDAINSLGDLIAKLNHIDGHNYHSTVTTDYIENRKSTYGSQVPKYSNSPPPSSSHPKYNALGSIRHADAGMIIPPRDPGTLIVGEPPTGGEAWIPLGGISQSRAMGLAQTVGDRYGFSVTRGNAGSGSMAVQVSLAAASGGNLTPLGTLINQMIRDGLIVVKASQVRAA